MSLKWKIRTLPDKGSPYIVQYIVTLAYRGQMGAERRAVCIVEGFAHSDEPTENYRHVCISSVELFQLIVWEFWLTLKSHRTLAGLQITGRVSN